MSWSITPYDKSSTKYLVVAGGDTVYYGKSATSFVDSGITTILTGQQLDMASAYQKTFIANASTLHVLDFGTVKIPTADVGSSALPVKTTQLEGGTSGAKMVVDFITTNSAADVYGYVVGTAAFTSGETVTGTDATLSISFVLSSAQNTGPHDYVWTTHANLTTYGALPDRATLAARYRGRIILSGNSDEPYNWYATKVADPFNMLYTSTDPLSAIAGNDGDAGEIGDAVIAMIPKGDDFLVFGCSNSMHLMTGDPMQGGSIDELSNTVGIYGPRAWCKDNDDNTYFYGNGGLYKMAGGRGRPQNLSVNILPNLATDLNAVASVDRVVLSYDNVRHGIILSRTSTSSGNNTNYFVDLTTMGMFPEAYPTNASVFCSQFWPQSDDSILILGCGDGYLRYYDGDAEDDDNGDDGDALITSYVGWVEPLIQDDIREGKLTELIVETAGGASSGAFTDTDSIQFKIFTGESAELVMEDLIDGATAFISTSFSGPGRQGKLRDHVRGRYIGFEFRNNTSNETWAINKVFGYTEDVGSQ
jgi:hypothetical protein